MSKSPAAKVVPKTASVPNMFAAAAAVSAPPPAKASKKKEDIRRFPETLSQLAAVETALKFLDGRKTVLQGLVKETMADEFVDSGMRIGKQPENFKAVSDLAFATCQLKKRSATSVLSQEEQELLEKMDVPVEKVVTVESHFYFNPAIFEMGPEVLQEISEKLSTVKALAGMQVIMHQAEVSKVVASDDSIDAVFKNKDESMVRKMLPMVSTLAVGPKMNADVGIDEVLQNLTKMLAADKKAAPTSEI